MQQNWPASPTSAMQQQQWLASPPPATAGVGAGAVHPSPVTTRVKDGPRAMVQLLALDEDLFQSKVLQARGVSHGC